jgi:hypothetical protein
MTEEQSTSSDELDARTDDASDDPTPAAERLSPSSVAGLLVLAVVPCLALTGFTSFEYMRRGVFVLGAGVVALLWALEVLRGRRAAFGSGLSSLLLGLFGAWGLASAAIAWPGNGDVGPLVHATFYAALGLFALPFAAPTGRAVAAWEVAGAVGVSLAAHGALLLLDAFGASPLTVVWDPVGATGGFGAQEFALTFMFVAIPVAALGSAASYTAGKKNLAIALAAFTALGLAGELAATVGPDPGGSTWASGPNRIEMYTKTKQAIDQLEQRPVNPRFAIMRLDGDLEPEVNGWARRVGMRRVTEKPVQGHGPGGWWRGQLTPGDAAEGWAATLFDVYPALRTPHSGALLVSVELGLLGAVLFYGWLLAAIAMGVGAMRRSTSGADTIALAALIVAVILGASRTITHTSITLASFSAPLIAIAATLTVQSATSEASPWSRPWRAHKALAAVLAVAAIGGAALHSADLAASYLRAKGDVFMLYAKYERARERYVAASEILPAHGETFYNVALAMERSQALMDGGGEYIDKALLYSPNDARAHYLQSKFKLRELRFAAGRDAAQEAISRFPNHLAAYKNIALYHSRRNEFQQAADVFEGMLERDIPDTVRAVTLMDLAEIYETPLGKPTLAAKAYEQAIPLLEEGIRKERARGRLPELRKRIERERLEREGKVVPPELMPANPHQGHDHAPGTFHPH